MAEINLYCDTETGSECDLKKHGTHRYAEHPSTHIQLFSYAFEDEPVKLWSPRDGEPMPADLKAAFANPDCIFWFHNAWFDRNVIEHCLGIRLPIQRYRCAMALALSHALPAGLEKLGEVLGLHPDHQKIKDGKRLVQKFCKPKKLKDGTLKWHTPETDPEDWARYKEYCIVDTASMREAIRKIPRWNYTGWELDLWFLDQTVNSRGMHIDLEFVESAVDMITGSQKLLAAKTKELTDNEVQAASQRDAMLQHIFKQYGYDLPDLRKSTVESLLDNDPDLPDVLRELLVIRLSTSTTSTAKYRKILAVTSEDSRVRGTIQYAGASRSLRDGGRMVQPQNFPRPTLENDLILAGIDTLKGNNFEDAKEAFDLVDTDPMELCSSALRYSICAASGNKLVIADLSNIEGRALAYLAKEEWKLKAFREYDAGKGPDLYKAAYAKAFGVSPESVTKDQRQVGKVLELACFGPDTQVLTDSGYKELIHVELTDRLWDGSKWVEHKGVVQRGVKTVIDLDGIRVTEDHLVNVKGEWMSAGAVASDKNLLLAALSTGLVETYEGYIIDVTKKDVLKVGPESLCTVYDIAYAGVHNRFTIKTNSGHLLVHNCGYGGGVGAVMTFATGFGIDLNYLADRVRPSVPPETWAESARFYKWLDDQDIRAAKKRAKRDDRLEDWEEYYQPDRTKGLDKEVHCAIDSLKRLWREGHPNIVNFWQDTDDAVRNAIAIPKKRFYFGNGLYAIKTGNWVRIVLPSGHNLPYPAMKIDYGKKKDRRPDDVELEEDKDEDENINPKGRIVFKGVGQYTRKWESIKTAGPKLCENIVQSFARDIFKYGQLNAENAGYPVVLPVHDENVTECPDSPEYSIHELERIMATNPPWAPDIPLAAEGFSDTRYHK